MTDARPIDCPVVVIGAGPIGLTLANLLGRYGVSTLLVERNPTTVQEPRAVSIDDESLRTMQAAGLVETVMSRVVSGYGSHYHTPSGRCFLVVEPTGAPYGYPRRNAFRQPVLEAQLREGLGRFPHVETLFGWRLDTFEQDHEAVAATLIGPEGQVRKVRSAYLVGCDGASSLVRRTLGLKLEGESFEERWLIVDLENSPTQSRHTKVFCDVRRPCIALPGPDLTRRFEFKLHPHETDEDLLAPETVQRLLREHGAAPESIVKRTVVYTFHARLAPTWSKGRVFLAGDACHLTPPFAGQGMNSGVRDAHNLAWKLEAVIEGRIGPGLLDTYEAERREHVGEMIQLALRMGRIMGPPSPLAGWLTQSALQALKVWPAARDYFGQMKYKPKPRFMRGFIIPDAQTPKRTLVGRLLAQPRVYDAGGEPVLLDRLLGDGFSLLALTDDPQALQAAIRDAVWERLGVRPVAVLPRGAQPKSEGAAGSDPEGRLAQVLQDYPAHAILLRPDHYVAATFPLGGLAEAGWSLEALLARTEGPGAVSARRAA